MPRRFPIIQFPNRALLFAMLARLVAEVTDGPTRRAAKLAAETARVVWAAQEIRSGANWFRRLLGLTVGVLAISRLLHNVRRALEDG